jgi:hypothetical protein
MRLKVVLVPTGHRLESDLCAEVMRAGSAMLVRGRESETFYVDREALDSVPFTKESERSGMSYMPGSLMNKDEYQDSTNENIDEDMHMPQPW